MSRFYSNFYGELNMKKQFTVADMISVLQKFDPNLPIYDCYEDENEGECWFNLQKPRPKVKKLNLFKRNADDGVVLKLTDERRVDDWEKINSFNVLILYPMKKGEIEIG
jgi:hypothetical protein